MSQLTHRKGVNGNGDRLSGTGTRSRPSSGSTGSSTSSSGLLRVASDLLRRISFAARAGFRSFRGRDLYQALGYLETISLADYRERYERGGIAGRIIDWLPEMTWGSGPVSIIETTKPDQESGFERDIGDLFKRLNIQTAIAKTDKLALQGQYAAILIGTSDPNLDQPITRLSGGTKAITYLMQIPQERARISEWVGQSGLPQDKTDPRFGKPKYYEVKIGTAIPSSIGEIVDTSSTTSLSPIKVHYSRILHVAHGTLENDIYGAPGLRRSWNDLDDFYKVKGGGSEAQWIQQSLPTLFDLNPDASFGDSDIEEEEELKRMEEEVEAVVMRMKSYGLTRGVTPNVLSGKGAKIDFASNGEFLLKVIAGANKIPFEALIGNMLGLRSSEQNAKAIQARVDENINEHAEPLLRDLIDRFIRWGVVAAPLSGDYSFVWPKEEELDELQKGELTDKYASANQKMALANLPPVITSDEIRDRILGLDPLLPEVEPGTILGPEGTVVIGTRETRVTDGQTIE